MSIQFAELGAKTQTQEDLDKAYRDSQIRSSIIKSYLATYFFPKNEIPLKWADLTSLIEAFYALTGIHEASKREKYLQHIKQGYFTESLIDWPALIDRSNPNYSNNWLQLRNKVLDKKDELIQNVIESRISAFS